jgi:hypothetical protein
LCIRQQIEDCTVRAHVPGHRDAVQPSAISAGIGMLRLIASAPMIMALVSHGMRQCAPRAKKSAVVPTRGNQKLAFNNTLLDVEFE